MKLDDPLHRSQADTESPEFAHAGETLDSVDRSAAWDKLILP
jgi:hypothetical protein